MYVLDLLNLIEIYLTKFKRSFSSDVDRKSCKGPSGDLNILA